MDTVYRHFMDGFDRATALSLGNGTRIGAELKFPLVNPDGTAADLRIVCALWDHLARNGWGLMEDRVTRRIVGVKTRGPQNDTVASCETGFCKTEFSLAHVADLFELEAAIAELRELLARFAGANRVAFLGYGIQPVTPPSEALFFKKERSCFWDKAFASNRHIPPEKGDDVCLFTVNAGSHVHLSTGREDAVRAVNVLNGFAGAQIALTAHSNIWQGRLDSRYKCVNEKLWDWWKPAEGRCGVPSRPFRDLEDYVRSIERLGPIYVKRNGKPILLPEYDAFCEYFGCERAVGETLEGEQIEIVPALDDIGVHNSCYWYTARISRFYTVENRAVDQQPPEDLPCAAALSLGLVSAAEEAWEELSAYRWDALRRAREAACRDGLAACTDGIRLGELAGRMVELAETGLRRRRRGEEGFLEPLARRLKEAWCPADEAAAVFAKAGIRGLVETRAL